MPTVSITTNASGGNDGFTSGASGSFDNTGEVEFGSFTDGSSRRAFLYFGSPSIPSGATIDSATLTVQAGTFDDMRTDVYAAKGDSPAAPTTGAGINALTESTASVGWVVTDAGTDVDVTSPSLVAVLQEAVDQGTWDDSSTIMLLVKGRGDVAANFRAYDGQDITASRRPTLDITYTEGSSTNITAIMHHRRLIGVS